MRSAVKSIGTEPIHMKETPCFGKKAPLRAGGVY
jgi:hypothetical protein